MLDLVGDILNWTVAGAAFPLMFLPLAVLAQKGDGRLAGAGLWLVIVVAAAGATATFAALAPRLWRPSETGLGFLMPPAAIAALIAMLVLLFGPARLVAAMTPVFDRIARAGGRIAMALVLAMGLVQFAVVIMRYVFGVNFIFMQESVTYMHGAVFLLAGGYALLTDDHVRVDIFYRDAGARQKALIDFAGTYLLLFPVCLLVFWTSTGYVGNAWAVREGSTEQSGIQAVYLLKTLIPAFALLLAMAGFVIAARAARTLRSGEI